MDIHREIRQATRALRASPGVTVWSIVILALGIGAVKAVFSVVNGMLLRPLPVTAQDRLVRITKNDVERGFDHYPLNYPEYLTSPFSKYQSSKEERSPSSTVWRLNGSAIVSAEVAATYWPGQDPIGKLQAPMVRGDPNTRSPEYARANCVFTSAPAGV